MNPKLIVFLVLTSFFSLSQAIDETMNLDYFVNKFESAAKNGKECERLKQKTSTECREFMSFLKTSLKSDSKEFSRKFSEYVALDLDKTLRVSDALIEISNIVASEAIKKHNKQINQEGL